MHISRWFCAVIHTYTVHIILTYDDMYVLYVLRMNIEELRFAGG